VVLVDVCLNKKAMRELKTRSASFLVVDHHETNEKDLEELPAECKIFDMKKAGCTLAWEFFNDEEPPELLNYAADQDLYLFKLPNSRKINKGFEQAFELPRSWDQEEIVEHFEALEMILSNEKGISKLAQTGAIILDYLERVYDDAKRRSYVRKLRDFPEIRACIVNATGEISDVGNAIISEKAPLGLVYFYKPQGNRVVLKVCLRSDKGRGANCAKIAEHYGGGGHPGAAGFTYFGAIEELFVPSGSERKAIKVEEVDMAESQIIQNCGVLPSQIIEFADRVLKEPPTAEGVAFLRALKVHLDESDPRSAKIDKLSDHQAAPPIRRCEVVVAKTDFAAWGEKQLSVKRGQRLALIQPLTNEDFMRCMTLKNPAKNEPARCGRVPVGYAHRVVCADRDFVSEGDAEIELQTDWEAVVEKEPEEGWTFGYVLGQEHKRGYFPAAYVKPVYEFLRVAEVEPSS
jgi:oligoribonuclease NrnB/cAMP/cGMP phosphodiesterase (DHH superfamily)